MNATYRILRAPHHLDMTTEAIAPDGSTVNVIATWAFAPKLAYYDQTNGRWIDSIDSVSYENSGTCPDCGASGEAYSECYENSGTCPDCYETHVLEYAADKAV